MIEDPFAFPFGPRKGSILDDLHLRAHQNLFLDLLLDRICQRRICVTESAPSLLSTLSVK